MKYADIDMQTALSQFKMVARAVEDNALQRDEPVMRRSIVSIVFLSLMIGILPAPSSLGLVPFCLVQQTNDLVARY